MTERAKDVASEFLFRLAPDVRPEPHDDDLCTLAFMFFLVRYDIDVRRGAARVQVTPKHAQE